jgi:branched-chain amino acid transport system ATP-binding protein
VTATTTAPLLTVRDLDVHRGEAHILHGVGFDLTPNRVTALLGRNGAGKTTTLLALMGLLPGRGTVHLGDTDLLALGTPEIVRLGVGYVPEDREVFSQLTVRENLRLAWRSPESEARMDLVHELFPELEKRAAQRAGTLSGGQQQMVAIARALLNPNRLLLVDEPTKGLAPIVIAEVVEVLERATTDTTVLLVEQNLRVAERLATDAVVINDGLTVYQGGMQELLADPDTTQRYLGVSTAGGAR